MTQLIERAQCAVAGMTDLEPLYTFSKFPVFMGCSDRSEGEDLREDMSWWISRSSGLIQLKHLIPLEVLYPQSHGAGGVGGLWNLHHQTFAKFLYQVAPSSVLEIGGAHGILSKEYQRLADIDWTIVEPNPEPVEGCKATFIQGFFNDQFSFGKPVDLVVHSHVFEHIYDSNLFMSHLAAFIRTGKHLVFSIPNMEAMLERKYTNCINFEHTMFLTEPYVEFLLAKHGFRVSRKQYFLDDHSIFYDVVRDPEVRPQSLPSGLYKKNRALYQAYIDYHQALIKNLNRKISDSGRKVYLFGAHVFAQYLIEFGLHTSEIVCLLDNDPEKHGKRLYGTNLKVNSPKILRDVEAPIVILKAGVYNEEIKADILENINPAATFLD